MFKQGQLTAQQIRELLQKKLKDDRIFGYDNFDEFNRKYFKKELVAFEEFHKIRQLKYARVKYNNRIGHGPESGRGPPGQLAQAGAHIGGGNLVNEALYQSQQSRMQQQQQHNVGIVNQQYVPESRIKNDNSAATDKANLLN